MKKILGLGILLSAIPFMASAQTGPSPIISHINPATINGGGQVTIHGKDLWGNILIINGEEAPSWRYSTGGEYNSNASTMTFVAPMDVGVYNIQVEQRIIGGRSNSVKLNVVPHITRLSPISAKVGDKVTVYGDNVSGNIVVFNGQALDSSVTKYSDTRADGYISFTVPSFASVGPNTVQIEQKIIGGRSNSLTLDVIANPPTHTPTPIYSNPIAPIVTPISPVNPGEISDPQKQQIMQLQQLLAQLLQQLIILLQQQQVR